MWASRPLLVVLLALVFACACGEGGVDEARESPAVAEPPVVAPTGIEPEPAAPEAVSAVLYGIGLSTDPYGDSRPGGVGVATRIAEGELRRSEIRDDDLGWFGPPRWIDPSTVVATRRGPPYRPPLLFAVHGDELEPLGPAPLGTLEPDGHWSPDGALIATEPIERCGENCYRSSGTAWIVDAASGLRRPVGDWHAGGWAPDGQLLVTDDRGEEYLILDLRTGAVRPVIDREKVAALAGTADAGTARPIWSADDSYIATRAGIAWGRRSLKVGTIVIARADGTPIRLLTSPYIISMLAWSPAGHRLAFTTSGFPDPHELFVLDDPGGQPRKLFATRDRHFDWFTWSPDGRYLLVDDASFGFDPLRPSRPPLGRWLLLDSHDGQVVRELGRLGGAPQWCCPVNAYVTLNG